MKRDTIHEIINSEKLKDIPLLDIIKVISVVLECEYDNENRSKKCRSSNIDEVFITIQ